MNKRNRQQQSVQTREELPERRNESERGLDNPEKPRYKEDDLV